jgi:hypothetical protein
MLTVCCVWVHANVPYATEYVTNLRSMVAKHLAREHQFVCLTDRPWMLPDGIRSMPIGHERRVPGWWAKIQLFKPGRFSGRVLYLDLDSLIVQPLDPVVDYPSTFALVPHAGTFNGRDGLRVVKRFNSSVMVWDARANESLFLDWTPEIPRRLWGDQDWIGEHRPDAATMPSAWFPRLSELSGERPNASAKVVLCKKPKNSIAADLYPWVGDVWRAA